MIIRVPEDSELPLEKKVIRFIEGDETPFDPGFFTIPKGKKNKSERAMILLKAGLQKLIDDNEHKTPVKKKEKISGASAETPDGWG